MTNHPDRSNASYRFIAFSTIHGGSLTHAETIKAALDTAVQSFNLADTDFIEVLDCGPYGRTVWTDMLPLHRARSGAQTNTVFRGAGL